MAAVEGPIPSDQNALPLREAKARYMFLNKEWSNATRQLNFTKVSELLTKYLDQDTIVENENVLITAVETLSESEDLPPMSNLMEDAGTNSKSLRNYK
jgi:hypothetical protein